MADSFFDFRRESNCANIRELDTVARWQKQSNSPDRCGTLSKDFQITWSKLPARDLLCVIKPLYGLPLDLPKLLLAHTLLHLEKGSRKVAEKRSEMFAYTSIRQFDHSFHNAFA
jgi:hypothetical protein